MRKGDIVIDFLWKRRLQSETLIEAFNFKLVSLKTMESVSHAKQINRIVRLIIRCLFEKVQCLWEILFVV